MNQRSPETKNSGIEWIGEIPKHWKVIRLKYVALANPSNIDKKSVEGETSVQLCNYMDVHKNEFITADMSFMSATATDSQIAKFSLKKGDVIATKDSEDTEDIAIPAVVKEDLDGVVCGYHLTHIKPIPDRLSGFYLFRLFQSDTFNKQFTVKANGVTRYGLSTDAFNDAFICLPPIDEQVAIANYLDVKTTLIDETISKKERLIQLLQEERTALINKAVTRGLDDTVPLKNSGVEWLGMIPEHWEMKKLKFLIKKIGSGVTPKGGAEVYERSGIPLIRSQNVYFDGLKLEDVAYITEMIHQSMTGTHVKTGDVLLNITGASIGRCYFVEDWLGEANVNQHVCIIRPSSNLNTKFLYFVLASSLGQTQIDRVQNGSNREGLNFEQIRNFVIPTPSVETQEKIVVALTHKIKIIDEAISKEMSSISFLQEYRTALINEVVTGKRCVL